MADKNKSNEELIEEIKLLQKRIAELETLDTERNQQQQIRRLSTVVCDSNDAIIIQGFDGRITAWNHGAELMYGYSEEEALQMNIAHLTPPDKVAEQEEFTKRLIAGEVITSFETQRVTKDGRILDVWLMVTLLIEKPAGSIISTGRNITVPIGIASVERNITERKKAEEALWESKELLSEITAQVPGVVYQFYARPNGEMGFYYVSDTSEKILGLKPDLDGYFERFTALVIPEHREGFIKSIKKAVSESAEWKYEGMMQKPSGEKIWFSEHSTPSWRENEIVFNGIVQDITERKKMEEELRKAKDYMQNLLDYVNVPIVTWNSNIRITVFNHAFERLTGRRADEVIDQQLDTLFPNETKRQSMAMIQRALVGERWEEVEIPIRHSDGSVRTVLLNFSTIFAPHSGSSVATIAYGQDITDRRKVEESQRLAQIGQLVAAMAHEVNNPLMIISGNAQLALMEGLKSRELKDELGIIVDQCERAKDIIQRLLKFAKPSKGAVKKVSINACIETAVKFLEHQYSLSNVKILRNFTSPLPIIAIDEKQIQEVLLNLFGNSFDAMPGGGTITITTSRTARNIHIKVADTGTGITEENLKKVATPFFTTKEKGTGLGLAVCHGIVRAHNGEMIYESKLGEGTTVTILLPIGGVTYDV